MLNLSKLVVALGLSQCLPLLFALLYGASNGLTTIARGILPLALFGREGYGEILRRIAAAGLAATASAPLLFASIVARFGPTAGLATAACAAALSLAAMLVLATRFRRFTR